MSLVTTTASSKAAVLNGMDALCTAAAMMADKPDGSQDDSAPATSVSSVAVTTAVPVVTPGSVPVAGDIVTYYRPIGPIQLVNKDGSATLLTNPIITSAAAVC